MDAARAQLGAGAALVDGITRWIGPERPAWQAGACGACLTLLPSIVLAAALFALLSALGIDPDTAARDDLTGSARDWVVGVLVAPAVETLLLAGLLVLLRPLGSTLRIALASALIWGLLHALIAWGAVLTAWPFFVFSLIWLARRPAGFGNAFAATTLAHALHNAVLFTAMA